jgi:outer membrane protein OmpA-like peptidoglycan-associated protein
LRIRAALAFTVLLAGCAAAPPPKPVSPELFVVVPGKDGHVGSIVVTRNGESRVIATAFGAQRIEPDGNIVAASMTRDQVHDIFASTVDALPGRPTSFTLYFLEGKDELTPDSRKEMDKVFGELKRRPLPDILVIGHTDTVGGLAYNDKLSLARAERLREMLVGMGIGADRVVAAGRGKRELLVPTDDNVPEARNRRVEINVR